MGVGLGLAPTSCVTCALRQDEVVTVPDAAVLFDLDGVLVDSRRAITGAINEALAEHGLPRRPPASLERFIGPPLHGAFSELTGQGPESPLVASCVAAYRRRYATASLRETVAVPGVAAALAELRQGWRLAVATSKPLAFAEPLVEALGLRDHFVSVRGPDLDVAGEEKATTIKAALRDLGCPQRAVVVGDRCFDVAGAHACGLPAIGVTWGIGDRAELESAGAEAIIEAPSELQAAVGLLLPGPREPTSIAPTPQQPPTRPQSAAC